MFKRDFSCIDFHPQELALCIGTVQETLLLDLQTFRLISETPCQSQQLMVKYSNPEMPLFLVNVCQDSLVISKEPAVTATIPCTLTDIVDVQWASSSNNYLLTATADGLNIHSSLFELNVCIYI